MKYLISLLLLTSTAFAADKIPTDTKKFQTIEFTLVVVNSDLSPSVEDQLRLFYEGISRLEEVRSRIKIIKTLVVPDVIQKNHVDYYWARLFPWADWARKNGIKGHVHFLLPTMYNDSGSTYGGGAAGAVCTTKLNKTRKYSYSTIRLKNNRGEDRQEHSKVIVAHELLHNLGANHIESRGFENLPNMMHPNAQAYAANGNLVILKRTLREVNYCRRGLTPEGKKPSFGIQTRSFSFPIIAEQVFN